MIQTCAIIIASMECKCDHHEAKTNKPHMFHVYIQLFIIFALVMERDIERQNTIKTLIHLLDDLENKVYTLDNRIERMKMSKRFDYIPPIEHFPPKWMTSDRRFFGAMMELRKMKNIFEYKPAQNEQISKINEQIETLRWFWHTLLKLDIKLIIIKTYLEEHDLKEKIIIY